MEFSPDQKKYIFLAIALSPILLILLWVFVLNQGTLVVTGEIPFTVEFVGAPKLTCKKLPCETKMFPGNYQATFKKDLYYDNNQQVNISRFGKTELKVLFKLIPIISEFSQFSEITFPTKDFSYGNNINDVSLLHRIDVDFNKFPEKFLNIIFSPKGNFVVIEGEKEMFLYSIREQKVAKLSINKTKNISWYFDESGIVYLNKDEKEKYQGVYFYDFKDKNLAAYMKMEIANSLIYPSPDKNKVLIVDKSDSSLYLIDLNVKSREKLDFKDDIRKIKWSPESDKILIQSGKLSAPSISVFHLKTKKNYLLKIDEDLKKVDFSDNNHIIFSTGKSDSVTLGNNSENQTVINLKIRKNMAQEQIVEFDLNINSGKTLINSTENFKIKAEKLELSEDKKLIYFLQNSKIYKVELAKDQAIYPVPTGKE